MYVGPMRTVRGDKKLDANVKAAVGVQLLIPLTVRIGPTYITAQGGHHRLEGADPGALGGVV